MDYVIADIEERRGWDPGHFDSLDHEQRAILLAKWQIDHPPPAEAKPKPSKGRDGGRRELGGGAR